MSDYRRRLAAGLTVLMTATLIGVIQPATSAAAVGPSTEVEKTDPVPVTKQTMGSRAPDQASLQALTGNQKAGVEPKEGAGTPTASPLSPSASWNVSPQTGTFTWSYPLRVPPVPGGLEPELALGYSSSAVDGRTSATNNQASWAGDGWDLSVGFIERTYGGCSTDGHPTKGDLCWRSENASAAFPGGNGQMAKDAKGFWRLESDNGARIEHLPGDSWKITTVDGTQYFFGSRADAGSKWTVPVYGDDAGEPCHAGTFAGSQCSQPWRWNLDKVVDTHGNQILYGYATETDTYRRNEGETRTSYVRGGALRTAEYGPVDGAGRATARVDFETADRCVRESECIEQRKENWPDSRADADPESIAPTFWITKRLSKVTTSVLGEGAYRPVDSWTLDHEFPNPGDGQKAALWLRSITRTGHVGGETTLPKVVFEGTKMANRVHLPDAFAPLNRYRITGIVSETGGVVDIKYRAPDCTPDNVKSIVKHENTKLCYPVTWKPQLSAERTDWFHKYVVDSVEELDRLGNTVPTSTRYVYYDDGAMWHYDTSEFTEEKKRTWSDYRGFGRVRVLTGREGDESGPVTMVEHRYHRGMHGDTLPDGGTRTVTVDGRPDHEWLSGFEYYEATHLGVSDTIVAKTLTTPDWQGPTASRGKISAYILRDGQVRTLTHLHDDKWREAKETFSYDDRGILTETDDLGDVDDSGDDRCATVTYVRNTADWILDRPARNVTVSVNCDATAVFPRDALSDTQMAYDGKDFGQAPSKGDVTHVKSAKARPAADPVYQTMSTTTYDDYGRVTKSGDALGRETTTAYEPKTGGPVTRTTITNPLGHATVTTLEPAWGQPTTTVGPNGAVTETQYDPLGRTAQVWLPNRPRATNPQGSHKFTYEIYNNKPTVVTTSSVGPRGNHVTTHTLYDGLMRPRQSQSPAAGEGRLIVDTHYDTHGRAHKTTNPYYHSGSVDKELWRALDTDVPSLSVNAYDGADRVVSTELRVHDTVKTRTTTTYGGDRVTVTPPNGAPPTTTVVNARGQTVEKIQAGESTKYGYSKAGLLASVTDPARNSWTFGYDLLGNRIHSDDLDKGESTATFDAAGQLKSTTDARGITLTYGYDDLGRRTSVKRGDDTLAEFTFDTAVNGAGLPARSIRYHGGQPYVTETLGYSLLGQVTREQYTIPETEETLTGTYLNTFQYNPDGSLASESYPAIGDQTQPWGLKQEIVTHTYDDAGRPLKTYGGFPGKPANYVLDNEYTRYGESSRLHLGEPPKNGSDGKRSWLTTHRELGTRRLERIIVDAEAPSPKQSDTTFAYDPAGNVTSIATQIAGGSVDRQCFRYDTQRRLTEAWTPAGQCAEPSGALGGPATYRHSFAYDAAGNRTSVTKNGTVTQYDYTGTGHRLESASTSGAREVSFGYDAAGNTTDLAGTTLEWDAEGHLAKAVKDGKATTFVYDADGARLLRDDPDAKTLYLAGQELRLEKASGARKATRYYSHGGQQVAVRVDGRLIWLSADHQGTTQVAIDADTLEVVRRYFDPFGAPRGPQAAFPGEKGFIGGTQDASTGLTHLGAREYSPDLGRFVSVDPLLIADEPQQLNGYAYAANTPVVMSDPTGLAGNCPDGVCTRNTCQNCASNRQSPEVKQQQQRQTWGPHYRSLQDEKAAQKHARAYPPVRPMPVANQPHRISPHTKGPKAPKVPVRAPRPGSRNPGYGIVGEAFSDAAVRWLEESELTASSVRDINPTGGWKNCVRCAIETDKMLAGKPTYGAPGGGPFDVEEITKYSGNPFHKRKMEDIMRSMERYGDGTRAIIVGLRKPDEEGHAFNVVNQGGVIRFLDGQSGGRANTNDGFTSFLITFTQKGRGR